MREIKFKAYCAATDKTYHVEEMLWNHPSPKDGFNPKYVRLRDHPRYSDRGVRLDTLSPGQIELMQYTGLKDKNNTDVYEGYVLDKKYRWVVVYRKGLYVAEAQVNGTINTDILPKIIEEREQAGCPVEVIGNIYENPELLD